MKVLLILMMMIGGQVNVFPTQVDSLATCHARAAEILSETSIKDMPPEVQALGVACEVQFAKTDAS